MDLLWKGEKAEKLGKTEWAWGRTDCTEKVESVRRGSSLGFVNLIGDYLLIERKISSNSSFWVLTPIPRSGLNSITAISSPEIRQ